VVGLDREHARPRAGERDRERPQAGTDLEDAVAGADARVRDDRAGEVRVGEEMLAEPLRGTEAVPGGERLQVRAAKAARFTGWVGLTR
jgi:hypothetical protein